MRAETDINPTTVGLLKAMHFIMQRNRKLPAIKHQHEPFGKAVHGRRCLKSGERDEMANIFSQMAQVENTDHVRGKELMDQLRKLPVHFVPVTRQIVPPTRPNRSKKWD